MQGQALSSGSLSWSSLISIKPTNHSTKFPREPHANPDPQILTVHSSSKKPDPVSTGLQRQPKKELSRLLRTDAAIKAIEQKANSNKYHNLWPKAVLEALDDAIAQNRWKSALKIFGLMRKQQWYEPRSQTYAKLLMMLGKCGQAEEAHMLIEFMRFDGLKPTVDVYTALVSAYGQSGQIDKAIATIDEMKSVSDCVPDVYTYSILINCCTKLGRYDIIERVKAEMLFVGIECSTVTYNTIIDGYGKAGMFEEMENSLTDMIENGSSFPDVFTLNSVIGAYGNLGEVERMEEWYDEFQLMGIKPDVKTFNILIRSYGKAGNYEKLRSVLEFMEKRYFSPTVVTYNVVIDAFGKAGYIGQMDEYFRKMKHQGVKPNTITYSSLVSAYSKAGLIMKVDSILRQVENSDVRLDTPFFNCIISAYGRASDVEKMAELFGAMKESSCKPDDITFATMIQAYSVLGMTKAVKNLEDEMNTTNKTSGIL